MFKKVMAGLSLLVLPIAVSASLITDTTNNTFIDNVQNLEWMDFGQNNLLTYNQVNNLIASPANSDNWRLATEEQAITLWTSLFANKGATANYFDIDNNYLMNFSDYTDTQLHWELYEIMGFNVIHAELAGREIGASRGLVANDLGGLTSFNFSNNTNGSSVVTAKNHKSTDQFYKTHTSEWYSTLLVRDYNTSTVTSVPEPPSLAIISLGLLALVRKRVKVNN